MKANLLKFGAIAISFKYQVPALFKCYSFKC